MSVSILSFGVSSLIQSTKYQMKPRIGDMTHIIGQSITSTERKADDFAIRLSELVNKYPYAYAIPMQREENDMRKMINQANWLGIVKVFLAFCHRFSAHDLIFLSLNLTLISSSHF